MIIVGAVTATSEFHIVKMFYWMSQMAHVHIYFLLEKLFSQIFRYPCSFWNLGPEVGCRLL